MGSCGWGRFRRTSVVTTGSAFNQNRWTKWVYNDRDELTESRRFAGITVGDETSPVTNQQFQFGYDPIGNRTAYEGDGIEGALTYTANNLNQYTSVADPPLPAELLEYDGDFAQENDGNLMSPFVRNSSGQKNPFLFSTKYRDSETGLYYYGYRYLLPRLGRWLNRDPLGELGGTNLYVYANNGPTYAADPLGLWGSDIHHDLVLELATLAGICCPEELAKYTNEPDTGYRRPGLEGVIDAAGLGLVTPGGIGGLIKIYIMGKWHFPRSDNGKVEPDSYAAQRLMIEGLDAKMGGKGCDLRRFGNGLHTYQDSWSHRGKPYLMGRMGHAYGAEEEVAPVGSGGGFPIVVRTGRYILVTGLEAALGSTIDKPSLFPDQARATAAATYRWLLKFKKSCPNACPKKCLKEHQYTTVEKPYGGSVRFKVSDSIYSDGRTDCGPATDIDVVRQKLRTRFPRDHDVVTLP